MSEIEISVPPSPNAESLGKGSRLRQSITLFWVSFLMLFLELIFIRWIGTEASIFAYLQNTILIVCFLGIGLGCLSQKRRLDFQRSILSLSMLVFLLSYPYSRRALLTLSVLLSRTKDLVVWNEVESLSTFETLTSIG